MAGFPVYRVSICVCVYLYMYKNLLVFYEQKLASQAMPCTLQNNFDSSYIKYCAVCD